MADETSTHISRDSGTWVEDDDNVQHGIDDNASGDAEKGATLGGIGGALTGLAAGAMAGPLGAVAGAVIGGVAGAVASGAAVAAIDRNDNDDTITGVGDGMTTDVDERMDDVVNGEPVRQGYTMANANDPYANTGTVNQGAGYNRMPGETEPSLKTGGYANDGTPDTRGVGEKFVDAITGDDVDDKTGRIVDHDSVLHGTDSTGRVVDPAYAGTTGYTGVNNSMRRSSIYDNAGVNEMPGESVPSIKTGGYANDGTPDTRGVGEKIADAVTGDTLDDKTGKVVNRP